MNKILLIGALFAGLAVADCAADWNELCAASNADCGKDFASAQCVAYLKTAKAGDACLAQQKCVEDEKAKVAQAAMEKQYSKYCPTDKAKCANKDSFCATWAAQKPSQCEANPEWMLPNCAQSCCPICKPAPVVAPKAGECPTTLAGCKKDSHQNCNKWAGEDECTKNPVWMLVNCQQSCCQECKVDAAGCPTTKMGCSNEYASEFDADAESPRSEADMATNEKACIDWGAAGECSKNPRWMMKRCSNVCCDVCKAKAPAKMPVTTPAAPVLNYAPLNLANFGAFGGYATASLPAASTATSAAPRVAASAPLYSSVASAAPLNFGGFPQGTVVG